jgi:DNA-binding transcriptional MocR family regulator
MNENTTINLYESLANELDGLIKTNVIRPGERLPSLRHLANKHQISISTVTQAMRLLQDRGMVDVRPQAGYFVRPRPRSLVNEITASDFKTPTYVDVSHGITSVLQKNNVNSIVQFASAWLPDDLMPTKRLQSVVGSVARMQHSVFNSPGFFNLNEPGFVRQIVRRAADWGTIDPTEIIVTSSGTEALSLCLRALAKEGDTIAIESPCHFLMLQLIQTLGMKALEIPTHSKTGISLEALELALAGKMVKACMFMPNASNPLGCIMPDANKKRLMELLVQHQIPLIENDLYGDLCFSTERPLPVKAFDTTGNVLLVSSFSKVISSALSAGYIMAGKAAHQLIYLKALSSGSASHFNQAVLAEMISGVPHHNHLRMVRRSMAQRVAQVSDTISHSFPSACSISEPQGGFVIWVQLPSGICTTQLHQRAVQNGIAFMPGEVFSPTRKFSNFMRLNCGIPWDSRVEKALQRLGRLVHEAVDAIE